MYLGIIETRSLKILLKNFQDKYSDVFKKVTWYLFHQIYQISFRWNIFSIKGIFAEIWPADMLGIFLKFFGGWPWENAAYVSVFPNPRDIWDLFIWWTKNWDLTQNLGFDSIFGIWPNFWDSTQFLGFDPILGGKSQFFGFATSWTRYRGKRLPLRYYIPSRWLKMLWGLVQILHEKLWGVQNCFLRKHLLKMGHNFAK